MRKLWDLRRPSSSPRLTPSRRRGETSTRASAARTSGGSSKPCASRTSWRTEPLTRRSRRQGSRRRTCRSCAPRRFGRHVLVTGDRKHFGDLLAEEVAGVLGRAERNSSRCGPRSPATTRPMTAAVEGRRLSPTRSRSTVTMVASAGPVEISAAAGLRRRSPRRDSLRSTASSRTKRLFGVWSRVWTACA